MALVAQDLKRALAYSNQSASLANGLRGGGWRRFPSQFHLLSHAVFKACSSCAGAVIHSVGTRDMRQMGGLGRRCPSCGNAFIIGALPWPACRSSTVFWSKELVLEAGLSGGPGWAFALMVIGAGLTACYTFRMVWLVFFGEPRAHLHAHETGRP
jgi:NADH-quinone oxidoreductase subunit L